ncbi:hypothetical protein IU433_14670 [Nocardia puris]|uniref:hypothetical protein n=1 Tax=Nocardia puris TaxID=208602 RepID=UPI001894881F|nr:hypothetical protein [Nocardia puris]MBF6460282.1 hypothetical protein [Nocardia puris]
MSTPVTTESAALPVIYEAPPAVSQGFGLYAAATLLDTGEVSRELIAGVDIYPFNCDTGVGTYSTELCDDAPAVKAAGERGEVSHFDPLVVYAAAECAAGPQLTTPADRARQMMALHEPLLVENAFAVRLLADAGAPTVVPDLAAAIGTLEEWLGERGYPGLIHAARRYAAGAAALNAASGSGLLRTGIGNTWVFGGGYADTLGATLIATGPVTVWRSSLFEREVTTGSSSTAGHNNSVYALSERVVTTGYECEAFAVQINPAP